MNPNTCLAFCKHVFWSALQLPWCHTFYRSVWDIYITIKKMNILLTSFPWLWVPINKGSQEEEGLGIGNVEFALQPGVIWEIATTFLHIDHCAEGGYLPFWKVRLRFPWQWWAPEKREPWELDLGLAQVSCWRQEIFHGIQKTERPYLDDHILGVFHVIVDIVQSLSTHPGLSLSLSCLSFLLWQWSLGPGGGNPPSVSFPFQAPGWARMNLCWVGSFPSLRA